MKWKEGRKGMELKSINTKQNNGYMQGQCRNGNPRFMEQ